MTFIESYGGYGIYKTDHGYQIGYSGHSIFHEKFTSVEEARKAIDVHHELHGD